MHFYISKIIGVQVPFNSSRSVFECNRKPSKGETLVLQERNDRNMEGLTVYKNLNDNLEETRF